MDSSNTFEGGTTFKNYHEFSTIQSHIFLGANMLLFIKLIDGISVLIFNVAVLGIARQKRYLSA